MTKECLTGQNEAVENVSWKLTALGHTSRHNSGRRGCKNELEKPKGISRVIHVVAANTFKTFRKQRK
jgi:hypothetical protein